MYLYNSVLLTILPANMKCTYNEKKGADKFPADTPIEARSDSNHGLDIVSESIQPVEPRNGYALKKC